MSTKTRIILAYFGLALLCAIYLANWGVNAHRGFFYNLGAGIFWPFMIPGVGKILGAIILMVIIGAILAS